MFTLVPRKIYNYTGTLSFEFQLVWKESSNSTAINHRTVNIVNRNSTDIFYSFPSN